MPEKIKETPIIFERKILSTRTSNYIIIPKVLIKSTGLKTGDYVNMQKDRGKHGEFIAFWKKKKQEKN